MRDLMLGLIVMQLMFINIAIDSASARIAAAVEKGAKCR